MWAVKCAPEPQVVLPAGTSTFSAVSCFTPVCGPWALRGRAWRETGAEEQAPPAAWASALGAPLSLTLAAGGCPQAPQMSFFHVFLSVRLEFGLVSSACFLSARRAGGRAVHGAPWRSLRGPGLTWGGCPKSSGPVLFFPFCDARYFVPQV